ncbi:hypothetical protein CPB97_003240 [Podila verticillata]|nr:hypothetical protein CPB97_003240 [Podila verticillata]
MASYESDQQLFADTLVQIQVHSVLAKEHVQNKRSPLPLLAKSCSLLDNLPASCQLSEAQSSLLTSLKIDAWAAFADACIASGDLVQAEASLQRLATLQEAQTGPLSWRTKKRPLKKSAPTPSTTSVATVSDPTTVTAETKAGVASPLAPVGPTPEQRKAALDLVETWDNLKQAYSDMGKQDLANNMANRINKMRSRLDLTIDDK